MKGSPMAFVMAPPRERYLSTVFQMLSFLRSKHNDMAVFDPSNTKIDLAQFITECCSVTPYGACKYDGPTDSLLQEILLTLITLVNRFLVAQELALLCSSIVFLSLFILKIRVVARHLDLF